MKPIGKKDHSHWSPNGPMESPFQPPITVQFFEAMDETTQIHQINENSIKKICSGQVIVSTLCVVKELIENSIDANATNIVINFKDFGKEISVTDNGTGISKQDYNNLCKKHHTSKISSDFDLGSLSTLGFRGEALSSLSELSNVTIITRTSDDSVGTILDFDSSRLLSQKPQAREIGTTVIVKNLFKNLPVRYTELQKNLKREYAKCISLIQEYSLINQVRFIVQHNLNNKNQTVLSSKGLSLDQNIKELLGKETVDGMAKFEMSGDFDLVGWISKPNKSTKSDFEYVFINKRPVDLKFKNLITKLKNLNDGKKPSLIFDLTLSSDRFDVNVTPNKRKVILKQEDLEKEVLDNILDKVWEQIQDEPDFEVEKFVDLYKSKTTFGDLIKNKTPMDQKDDKSGDSDQEFAKSLLEQDSEEEVLIDEDEEEIADTKPDARLEESVNKKQDELTLKPMITKITPQKRSNVFVESSSSDSEIEPEEIDSIQFEDDIKITCTTMEPPMEYSPLAKRLFTEESTVEIEVELDDVLFEYQSIQVNFSNHETVNFSKRDISDEESSINELDRRIHKNDFSKMSIIGQYNQSFIICHLDNDLFILDQHACDEKYNYETMFTEKLNTQPLIVPKMLDVSDQDFELMVEKEKLFEQYGFQLDIDGKAIKTVPFSRNTVFNEKDVLEMLFLLKNNPDLPCRPSKIQKMFASRACRMSVMFGDALSDKEMKRIVQHLTQLNHPWCCPHGRPTMRFIGTIKD